MNIINCTLIYKCKNCDKTIEEQRSHIPSPGLPGTLMIDDYFEYKKITHQCEENTIGFCDIIGYKIKGKNI